MRRLFLILFVLCPISLLANIFIVSEIAEVDLLDNNYKCSSDTIYSKAYFEKKDTVISNIYVNPGLSCYNDKVLYYEFASDKLNSTLKKSTSFVSETENYIALKGSLIKPNLLDIGIFDCVGGDENMLRSLSNKLKHKIVFGFAQSKIDSSVVYIDISIGNKHSALYEIKYKDSKWLKYERVPFCKKNVDYGMPRYSKDGHTLFFASNDRSGYGGWDIYSVQKTESGLWQKPINMGLLVNTKGNELNPYLSDDGHIYFSSNGRASVGGYDVFKVDLNKRYREIKNLNRPINTIYDDMSIVVTDGSNKLCVLTCRDDDDENEINTIRLLERRTVRKFVLSKKTLKPDVVAIVKDDVPAKCIPIEMLDAANKVDESIYFRFGKYDIRDSEFSKIDNIIEKKYKEDLNIEVVGFASTQGGELYNILLSKHRIEGIVRYLHKHHGIDKSKISILTCGEYVSGSESDSRKVDIMVTPRLQKKKRIRTFYKLSRDMSRKELAKLFNVTTSEIDDLNGNVSTSLKSESIVIVPVNEIYRMQAGDTFNKIAKRFKVNLGQLKLINNRLKNIVEEIIIVPNRNKLI